MIVTLRYSNKLDVSFHQYKGLVTDQNNLFLVKILTNLDEAGALSSSTPPSLADLKVLSMPYDEVGPEHCARTCSGLSKYDNTYEPWTSYHTGGHTKTWISRVASL